MTLTMLQVCARIAACVDSDIRAYVAPAGYGRLAAALYPVRLGGRRGGLVLA